MPSKIALLSLSERMARMTDRSGGPDACWPWTGKRINRRGGYGIISLENKARRAHRVAWIAVHGAIPTGMQVCHRCDNPACCNPAHLFLGTNKDNVADMIAKGRNSRGEKHGRLTAQQVTAIRESTESQRTTARRFGVCQQLVSQIKLGKCWRHI